MDFRLTVFICLMAIVAVSAYPSDADAARQRRDVMESMKNAWNEVVKTLSDAGDAVVHVFKPTEKSFIEEVDDAGKAFKQMFVPTEKSTFDKMADGIKSLGQ